MLVTKRLAMLPTAEPRTRVSGRVRLNRMQAETYWGMLKAERYRCLLTREEAQMTSHTETVRAMNRRIEFLDKMQEELQRMLDEMGWS
jgi:hypothetical protein